MFGRVLADYIDDWYDNLKNPSGAIVIDAGCGPGSLAASISRANMKNASEIEFYLVDISAKHRAAVTEKLSKLSPKFSWSVHGTIPECDKPTLVIANELLDNLIFNIGKVSEVYSNFEPDYLDKPAYAAFFGISGDIDNLSRSNVAHNIGDFRIPLHVGLASWIDELMQATMNVTDLQLLFFDYIKAIPDMADENWLRMYSSNQRIVGVDNVLNAIVKGKKGDITCDVTSNDLYVLLDREGFSKIKIQTQNQWLNDNDIDLFCVPQKHQSSYDQLIQFSTHGSDVDMSKSFMNEREVLLDENGLGSFQVLSAVRQV